MGWGNVPDDWGCYFSRCPRCGTRVHASEGGCSCIDYYFENLEPCQCGACDWDGDEDRPRCEKCGTGPHEDTGFHTAEHTARKAHKGLYGLEIRPGDRYRRRVHFGYYPDGAFTLRVTKERLSQGPAWEGAAA
jgi:hypothetical protein